MEPNTMLFLGKLSLGLIMGFGALGSALGVLAAGTAAAAAWAKEGKEGKAPSFLFAAYVGMPLSQTLYCMICYFMMNKFVGAYEGSYNNGPVLLGIAIGVGIAQFISAFAQGKIGGAGIRCLSENGGKGNGQIMTAMGIAESIGVFALVTAILILANKVVMVMPPEAVDAAKEAVKTVAPGL